MFWDGFQWIAAHDQTKTKADAATRKLRRLYLGNLPLHLGLTEDQFKKDLIAQMRQTGVIDGNLRDPYLQVWFAQESLSTSPAP